MEPISLAQLCAKYWGVQDLGSIPDGVKVVDALHAREYVLKTRLDRSNTLGYNLGAGLGAIHFKEHLLKKAVADVARQKGRSEAEASSWHTQAYCERDGFVWKDNSCHAR